jgi:LemA protein
LLAVVENYPQLKATENFQTLQAQLEGTENRIAFERRKYNDVARDFNTKRDTFPTVLFAGMFGSRFNEKPYFQAQPGAQQAPVVNFSP